MKRLPILMILIMVFAVAMTACDSLVDVVDDVAEEIDDAEEEIDATEKLIRQLTPVRMRLMRQLTHRVVAVMHRPNSALP